MMFTEDNLRTYLRTRWAEQGEDLAADARLGIEIAELMEASKKRNAAIDAPFIDLWVAILDELNSWLISLLSAVYMPAKRDDATMNDFERSVVMILVKLISDTTSLRHLVMLGFDTSARTLLRSIVEYMQVLVAIIDDPALATEFVTAETPESANAFYFRQLARGKLHKRIEAAWARFFKSKDGAAQFFANQQRELGQLLAGTAHPSFAGGHQAVIGFIQSDPNEKWLGHWGAKSNMSVLTISIYTSCFMPLLLLSDFPFEGFDAWLRCPIDYDPSDEMHRHVKAGRSVLASLILSLSKESNIRHIFPEGFEPDVVAE
jgi:hypothetical protein